MRGQVDYMRNWLRGQQKHTTEAHVFPDGSLIFFRHKKAGKGD
jgi:hypothetical protein